MVEKSLAEQIAMQLRRDILRGKLAPGAALKERDHAEEIGVSRTPMREAIRILAKEGLVELRPARSPIVAKPSLKQLTDNIEVLNALELLSAELACTRASDAEIRHICTLQDKLEALYNGGKDRPVRSFEADMNFHIAIVKASANPVLADSHRAILARLWRVRFLSANRHRSRALVIEQHRAIVAGLQARDPDAVRRSLGVHLERLLTNVREDNSDADEI